MVRSGYAQQLYDFDAQLHFQRLLVGPGDVPLPFNRPAFEALLFVPFSFLSYRAAYFTLVLVNVVLLAICFRLLRGRLDNLAAVHPALPVAVFAGFLPLAAALMQGQDSILLLTLLTMAMVLLERGRDFGAGLLVGLGLFKLQIVLPLVVLFLVWRRWRFSAGFLFWRVHRYRVLARRVRVWHPKILLLIRSDARQPVTGRGTIRRHQPELRGEKRPGSRLR